MNELSVARSIAHLRFNLPEAVEARGCDGHSFGSGVIRTCVCVGVRYTRKEIILPISSSSAWILHCEKKKGMAVCWKVLSNRQTFF